MTEGETEHDTPRNPGPPPVPRPGPPGPGPAARHTPIAADAEDPAAADAADPRIEAVLADLEQLAALPVDEHLAVYEQVHAKLREVLQSAGQGRSHENRSSQHRPGQS